MRAVSLAITLFLGTSITLFAYANQDSSNIADGSENAGAQTITVEASQKNINTNMNLPGRPESLPDSMSPASKLPVSGSTTFLASTLGLYTVVEGDTLSGISEKFNIKISTIMAANDIEGDVLKIDRRLLILPGDGLLLKTDKASTIDQIAEEFKTNSGQLIADNGLTDTEDLPELLYCHRCAPQGITIKATAAQVELAKPVSSTSKKSLPYIGSTDFPVGNCTYYVARRMLVTFNGHARDWLSNAQKEGYKTGNAPIAGAAVVTKGSSALGHVAYVEQVKNESIIVSEMNYECLSCITEREIPIDSPAIRGYIYPLE